LVTCAGGVPASVAATVKLKVPVAVGVPEIVPVEDSVNPVGNVPEEMLQETGKTPPVLAKICEYATLVFPCGNVAVVIVNAGTTVNTELPKIPSCVALMVALPLASVVATPATTVATAVFVELQVAVLVMSEVEESLNVPVATKSSTTPFDTVGFSGVTAMEVSVGVAA
jgi:hypothetical protein